MRMAKAMMIMKTMLGGADNTPWTLHLGKWNVIELFLFSTPLVQMIINHFGIKIPCGVLSHISLLLQESEIYLAHVCIYICIYR